MYENTLIKRISLIFENLRCKEIIDFLNQWNIDKVKLLSLVIESKLGFDRIILNEDCKNFIEDIEESSIYSVTEYSQLIMFISTMGELNSRFNNDSGVLNRFQTFHKMLFKTGSLVLKLLHENNEIMEHLNPQTQPGMVGNPLRNNMTPPPPGAAQTPPVTAATPSKVVSFDFSKLGVHQNVQTVQPPVQDKYVEPQKKEPVSQPASYYMPEPVQEQRQTEEDDDMSLNNFLQSLAMLNVPAE
ncbi:MAG: hypothetical protein NVSMB45_04650 [Ginsengibacter sp.]